MNTFYKTYNGITLSDHGSVVSPEYKEYQKKFFASLAKMIKSMGGVIVRRGYGHYDESAMMKFGDKYIYLSRSGIKRSHIDLDGQNEFLVRTAANESDWRGGFNTFTNYSGIENRIQQLLED